MKFTTPLYELFQDEQRNRIFIKRDDLLPDSLGGNKVRIAEAFFRDMEERDCDALISGPISAVCWPAGAIRRRSPATLSVQAETERGTGRQPTAGL